MVQCCERQKEIKQMVQCLGKQKEIKQMIGVQKNLMLLQKAEGIEADDTWVELNQIQD